MAKFAFSALFSAVGVSAAFDDAIVRDAAQGRVNHAFAKLAASDTESARTGAAGLPLLKADGNPIAKAAFLKLADSYRAASGAGHGVRGYLNLRAWGEALDTIALHLRAGAEPSADAIAAYAEAGQYRDAAAWALACPAPVKKAVKGAGTVAPAPAAAAAAAPAPAAAAAPAAAPAAAAAAAADDNAIGAESAGGTDGAPRGAASEGFTVDAETLLETVILALSTGAFTGEELARLGAAVSAALGAAADTAEEAAGIAHALQTGQVVQGAALAH